MFESGSPISFSPGSEVGGLSSPTPSWGSHPVQAEEVEPGVPGWEEKPPNICKLRALEAQENGWKSRQKVADRGRTGLLPSRPAWTGLWGWGCPKDYVCSGGTSGRRFIYRVVSTSSPSPAFHKVWPLLYHFTYLPTVMQYFLGR